MDVDELIRQAARKVAGDPQAAALFECLRPHFLNSDHDVGSMLRACDASQATRRRLVAILGPLKTFVTELRMTDAARRVRDTEETVEELRQRFGFTTKRGFRRAFRRFHRVNPGEMRRQAQAPRTPAPASGLAGKPTGDAPSVKGDARPPSSGRRRRQETPRARALRRRRRAALGLIDPLEAGELRAGLRRRHPHLDREDAGPGRPRGSHEGPNRSAAEAVPRHGAVDAEQLPVTLTPTADHLEDVVADVVLDRILALPEDERRFALLEGVRFAYPGPFHELCNRCMRMAAADPERAVALAELGVRLIAAHREMTGDGAGDWQAVAWASLGRVQAHLGDGGGAERSLAAARAELGGGEPKPWVEVEIRRVEGMVRKLERRWDDAVRAVDRAVRLTRRWHRGNLDRWQILFQRLELTAAMGDAEAGLAFAAELEELLDAWPESAPDAEGRDQRLTLWRGFVSYQRGKAHAAAGDDPFAEHFLRRALDEVAADPECDDDDQLQILFTLVLHELSRVGSRIGRPGDDELILRRALDRYRLLGTPLLEAAAEAELALLCALRGGWAEARELASSSAEFLDDVPFHREAWLAAGRLRELEEHREWSDAELAEVLAEIRRDLDLVAWEIPAPQARAATLSRAAREEEGEEPSSGEEEA